MKISRADILREIQTRAEWLPHRGIGANGPTLEQLEKDALEKKGNATKDDAVFHQGQTIWRLAERALEELK